MAVNKIVFNNTTLIDLTDSTLSDASDLALGITAYTRAGVKITGTGNGGSGRSVTQDQGGYIILPATSGGSGGGGGATQHTIHFEFSDSTDADIDVYYDDALLSTIITAYTPTTYGTKNVDSASLDGVAWYTRPTETWETIYDRNMRFLYDGNNDYPYSWVSELEPYEISEGSVWRVTYQNTAYQLTAIYDPYESVFGIGNAKYLGSADNGVDAPFCFVNMYGAWIGGLDVPNVDSQYYFKIERLVSS